MANVTSAVNTNSRDLDPVVNSAGYVGIKRGIVRVTATSTTPDTLAQAVGTHTDDAAFAIGDAVVVLAGVADETSSDSVDEGDAGGLRMGLDRVLLVRESGPATTLAVHAVSVTAAATAELGTAISANRRHIEFYNAGTATVYLGPSTVGTASGFPLGTAAYANFNSGHRWYAIAAGGTVSVRVMEMS